MAAFAAAGVFATAAAASPSVGFADDATKYSDDGGAQLFDRLKASGAVENRVAVYWDPANPTQIQEKGSLDRFLRSQSRRACASSSASTRASANTFQDGHGHPDRRIRRLSQAPRADLPAGARLRRPERAERGLLAGSPARRHGGERLRGALAAHPRRRLRGAGGPVDPGIDIAGLGISPAANNRTIDIAPSASSTRSAAPTGHPAARRRSWTRSTSTSTRTMPPTTGAGRPLRLAAGIRARRRHPGEAGDLERERGTGQPVFQEPGAAGPFLELRIGEIGWQVHAHGGGAEPVHERRERPR